MIQNTGRKCAILGRKAAFIAALPPLQLCDISLRDGLQTADPSAWPTAAKKALYGRIQTEHNPSRIEVGSIVSTKLLPIMADSLNMLYHGDVRNPAADHFLLVPNLAKLREIEPSIRNGTVRNISLITSASDAFQKKNTGGMTTFETYVQHREMSRYFADNAAVGATPLRIRLYMSCIDCCPLTGPITERREIMYRIMRYREALRNGGRMQMELILSDTCGNLEADVLAAMLREMCHWSGHMGIPAARVGLHLHVNPGRLEAVKATICAALDAGVTRFDVTALEEGGGCSVTMGGGKSAYPMYPNLTYGLVRQVWGEWAEAKWARS